MAEEYSFFNSKDGDRKYNARRWADYFRPLFKSGVFNGDLQVAANSGMSVKVNDGYAWIDGYNYHLTDGLTLDLETASGNMNRKDNIVLRLDQSNRWVRAFVVTGSYYAAEPAPPEPERSSTRYEIVLCRINIPAGTTGITPDMIEDTRMNTDLCGWVTGAVEQIDFSQISTQFEAYFTRYKEDIEQEFNAYTDELAGWENKGATAFGEMKEQFDAYARQQAESFLAWFDEMKGQLSGDIAGNLQLQTDDLKEQIRELKEMLISGTIRERLITSGGDYLTDNLGNPLLASFPICACKNK